MPHDKQASEVQFMIINDVRECRRMRDAVKAHIVAGKARHFKNPKYK